MTKKPARLQLNRETVRKLNPDDLKGVAAGRSFQTETCAPLTYTCVCTAICQVQTGA